MNRKSALGPRLLLLVAGLACASWAGTAQAYAASIIASVHMRAGPSTEYPLVALLGTGTSVQVYGCEQGYGWCDVQVGANRGWVDAAYLQAQSASGPVVVADAGLMLALPIIAFSFGTYWDSYYRGSPWYSRRPYYYNYWNRYPHGRPPPPPMHRPPGWRPPPPHGGRPPGYRPPPGGGHGGSRPPPRPPPGSGRPPGGGKPPGGGRPPGGGKPPGGGNGGRPPGGGSGGMKPTPRPTPRPAPQPR